MTLEDKLRAYAAKGELVHLSIVYTEGEFRAAFACASAPGGYVNWHDKDPVAAIENALKASPARPARVPKPEITAPVTDELVPANQLPENWTNP